MKLIFLDTETTGLEDDLKAEVVEYCFAEWDSEAAGDSRIVRIDEQKVLALYGCPEGVAKVNGYSDKQWRAEGAVAWNNYDCDNVCSYLTPGCYIAGSNPRFDVNFLKRGFALMHREWPRINHRHLNLASLAWPLWAVQQVEGVGLAYLTDFFGIEHQEHTARGDVLASVAVWEALFDLYVDGPKRMKEALIEIGADALEKGDAALADYCAQHTNIVPWKAGA